MKSGMFLYPWDLRDEGAGMVAERLMWLGVDSVALATSYHAGKFLRPHSPRGKVYYPEDGTVYFRPDPALYGRLTPQVATMADEYDALSALASVAPGLRCGLDGWPAQQPSRSAAPGSCLSHGF